MSALDTPNPAPEGDGQAEAEGGAPGCTWCERGSGMILVLGAVGLLYIGLDLISGGRLSQLFVGTVNRAAEAIDPEGQGAELVGGEGATGEPSA